MSSSVIKSFATQQQIAAVLSTSARQFDDGIAAATPRAGGTYALMRRRHGIQQVFADGR
jgi:hypothetical protein